MSTENSTPQTGQTGQPLQPGEQAMVNDEQVRECWFEIAQESPTGLWRWCLWSGNGRIMAVGLVGYSSLNECRAGVKRMVEAVRAAKIVAVARK